MNIFYASPDQIGEDRLTLTDQEARHAVKTLRYQRGDEITVVDGRGGWYEGEISQISDQQVWVSITSTQQRAMGSPQVTIALGIIKKRDRLEFAVEKAVELGAAEIAVFRAKRSVKQNVRMDRLETTAIAAMKQSLQAWLPRVIFFNSLHALLQNYTDFKLFAAHKSGNTLSEIQGYSTQTNPLLLVGPEGDFAKEELQLLQERKAKFISLGKNRLRTETAAITFLNSYLLLSR